MSEKTCLVCGECRPLDDYGPRKRVCDGCESSGRAETYRRERDTARHRRRRTTRRCRTCKEEKAPEEYRSHTARQCEACRAPGPIMCRRCREVKPRDQFASLSARTCDPCKATVPPHQVPQPRACFACLRVRQPWEFGPPRRSIHASTAEKHAKRWSTVCLECWELRDAEAEARRMDQERSRTTYQDGETWMRRCPDCRETKPLEVGFYVENRNAPTIAQRYQYHCKACQIRRVRRYAQRKLEEDPEGQRARNNAAQRRWRQENEELYRASLRRYSARVLADPERRARRAENQRIAHRLKREREGLTVRPGPSTVARAGSKRIWFPVGPFVQLFERILARELYSLPGHTARRSVGRAGEATEESVCAAYGVHPRRWNDYKAGRAKHVDFAVVDRVLTVEGLHWWDVWNEAELPEETLARLTGEARAA